MPFQTDAAVAQAMGRVFGEYIRSFRSANGQVEALLFKQGGWLIAHISRPTGLEIDKITDPYLSELQQFAREQGFEQRLRLIYSD